MSSFVTATLSRRSPSDKITEDFSRFNFIISFNFWREMFVFLRRRNLGGKLGRALMDDLGIQVMSDLVQFKESDLTSRYGPKTG